MVVVLTGFNRTAKKVISTGFLFLDSAVMCEPGAWYKLNYGASGFYRVNYDESNWNSLLKLLNDNHEVLFVCHNRDWGGTGGLGVNWL